MTSNDFDTPREASIHPPLTAPARPSSDAAWSKQGLFWRVVKNSGMVLSGKGVATLSGLAYLALAARGLGAADFGIIVLTHSLMILITQIMSFKSSEVLIKYGAGCIHEKEFEKFQRLIKLTLSLDLASGIVGALVAIATIQLLGSRLGLPDDAVSLASAYCVLIVLNITATPSGILRLFNRFDLIAYQMLVDPLTRLIGTAAAFYFGAPWQTYLLVWFLARFANSITLIAIAWLELRRQDLLRIIDRDFRNLAAAHPGIWTFSWSSNLHGTVNLVGTQMATLLVAAVLGPAGAALFKIAQEIASVIGNASQFINNALYPELVKLAAASAGKDIGRIIKRAGRVGMLVGIGFTAIILIGGKAALFQLFGAEFVGAFGVLVLMSLASTIELMTFPYEPALYVAGRPQIAFYLKFLTSGVQIVALFVLLNLIGLSGAGYAAIIASSLAAVLLLIVTKRVLKRSYAT
jgi:O-antigen/teichoic acid export membrane protein